MQEAKNKAAAMTKIESEPFGDTNSFIIIFLTNFMRIRCERRKEHQTVGKMCLLLLCLVAQSPHFKRATDCPRLSQGMFKTVWTGPPSVRIVAEAHAGVNQSFPTCPQADLAIRMFRLADSLNYGNLLSLNILSGFTYLEGLD
ncbi:hypothetical protein KAI87_01330 [Myxococcota bacterium]|nr:hypothetical protein [Myxococcota bacterium]